MKNRKVIGYSIYGILITLFFLYVGFPSKSVTRYIETAVEGANSGVLLSVDSIRPSLPPGLNMTGVEARFAERPEMSFKAQSIKVRPAITSLLTGRLTLIIKGNLYNGKISARISFLKRFSTRGQCRIKTSFSDIQLGNIAPIEATAGRNIDGKLSGSLSYDGDYRKPFDGKGQAVFSLTDGKVELLNTTFGFDALKFDKAGTKLRFQKRTLTINALDIEGTQLIGSFKGNLFFEKDIMQSRLDVKGDVEIPALGRKVTTTLKGTLLKPIPGFE